MYQSLHPQLISLVQESEVLQKKLSPTQMEKFLEASIDLPFEKQEELVQQLSQEKQKLSTLRNESLQEYEKQVKKTVQQAKKQAEFEARKNETAQAEKLLTTL